MRDLEKELRNSLIALVSSREYMFYGYFLSDLNKRFDNNTETACIGKHESATIPEVRFSPNFWEKYLDTKSKRLYIILHELGHLIHEHIYAESRELYPDKLVANIAFDMFINQGIKEESPIDDEGKPMGMLPSSFPLLKLKPNENSMYYYKELIKAKEKKKESAEKGQDSKAGAKGNKQGTTGDVDLDRVLDSEKNIHITWEELTEEMSDVEKELLKRQIQASIKSAAQETEKNKGDLPVSIEGYLTDIEKTEQVLPWGQIFKRFVGNVLSMERLSTRKRPNFRFPDAPSQKTKTKVKGVVLCDSSGSMSDHDISEINSQLYWIWKGGTSVDFASWDADCEVPQPYDGKLTFERTKCGGTRMGCAIEYVNEHYKKEGWSFAVIGTDGYIESDPPDCKIPTIIVITQTGNVNVNTNHKIVQVQ